MGQVMTLIEAVNKLETFDDEYTIYAEKPWKSDSNVIVGFEPDDDDRPQKAKDQNLDYFLEVFVALEFIDGWLENVEGKPSEVEICNRLIKYAINDA